MVYGEICFLIPIAYHNYTQGASIFVFMDSYCHLIGLNMVPESYIEKELGILKRLRKINIFVKLLNFSENS